MRGLQQDEEHQRGLLSALVSPKLILLPHECCSPSIGGKDCDHWILLQGGGGVYHHSEGG